MSTIIADLRYAARRLRRSPGFTTVVVLSLTLGIGANAAIFSLFEQTLLRPLPVQDSGRLVNLSAPGPKPGSTSCNLAGDCDQIFSYAMFRDLEEAQSSLDGLAAHRAFPANLATGDATVTGSGMLVSGSYFSVLGLRPFSGRLLSPSDDQVVGGHPVAVLSHGFWERTMGSDPGVLDRPLTVNGHTFTIIGVAPEGFTGTTQGMRPDVFIPLTMRGVVEVGFDGFENRRNYWAYLFGRVRPGSSVDMVSTELNLIYRGILNEVEAPLQEGMSEATLARFRDKEIVVEPGARGQSAVHENARLPMILLFGITAMVLLIACANIANLLLARGMSRSREMAVRGSLGAGRSRLVRQLLTEAGLLAALGGIVGLFVARWTLIFIGATAPPELLNAVTLRIEPSVLFYAAGLALATGLFFGLYPALHATRSDLIASLKSGGGGSSGTRAAARFRTGLVTAQIALSMMLLVSSGLFLRSLANVSRVDLGLVAENVVTFQLSPIRNGYDVDARLVFFREVEDELSALPGVTGVTASSVAILSGANWNESVTVEGFESGPDTDDMSSMNRVGAGYFRALGVPLLAGREFTEADGPDTEFVAIVNEAFTRKFGLDPRETVGRFMAVANQATELDVRIVGVVGDANYSEVKDDVPPVFFLPATQPLPYLAASVPGTLVFYVRTASDTEPLLRAIPGVIRGVDPNLPVDELKTLQTQIGENVFVDRMIGTLATAFALLATLLAAIGLYGVLAYVVTQRTREIGVRMALGAETSRVRNMVLAQVGRMTLAGGALGLVAAILLGRAAESLLFDVTGRDPWVLLAGSIVLGLVALAAGYLPARRASRVDPMIALRAE